ncbi:hypothetical protein [Sphaerisporangium corydalis]|uniref:Uncharacterized protein n=1 Tax=Sphaerisporangium corydalis TaxID=1441875 RepID=A0ABV9ETH4_9ACTN|nr:hypothetical protein [Sphaerisporangium corydalis]
MLQHRPPLSVRPTLISARMILPQDTPVRTTVSAGRPHDDRVLR